MKRVRVRVTSGTTSGHDETAVGKGTVAYVCAIVAGGEGEGGEGGKGGQGGDEGRRDG